MPSYLSFVLGYRVSARSVAFGLVVALLAVNLCVSLRAEQTERKSSPPAKDRENVGDGASTEKLAPMWRVTAAGLPKAEDLSTDEVQVAQKWVTDKLAQFRKDRRASDRPEIPPAVPVAVADLVVYSTDRSIVARTVRPTRQFGEPLPAGELLWESLRGRGLVEMSRELKPRLMLADWLKRHEPASAANVIFHRTLSTAFSVGGGFVGAVDEAGFLPPQDMMKAGYGFGPLDHMLHANSLNGVDLETGKLVVRLPDTVFSPRPVGMRLTRHQLGPPLIDGHLWYFVYEQERRFRLQCFDRQKYQNLLAVRAEAPERNSRVWDTELSTVFVPVSEDVHRRLHALHLARSGDILVCPTNYGGIVGVDVASGKVEWVHGYNRDSMMGFRSATPEWVVVPPVVTGDKYVYAPADFPELLCLNVADGKKAWSAKKGDGLYPAVVGDQVLVIGERTVRALRLKDGTEAWKADLPGLPCGRGAALGDTYLVPVSEPKTWRGMIAVVDLKAGKVAEVLKPKEDVPIGNLVVHEDVLISQTLTDIAVYPIRKKD